MQTYEEFINNVLETRGRFACGDEYHERHHIVPKCMGGTNEEKNLIDLFAREHFEAHRLLALENPDSDKLAYAWWMMSHARGNDNQQWYELTPDEYNEARIAFVNSITGENHPNYGKHYTEATKQKISEARKGQHPSEEARKKMSESRKGEKNYNYGKPISDEQKKKLSESLKGKMCGTDNPFYGKHHSEETKQIMSSIAKERLQDSKNHPNYGKHLSDETRKKISESRQIQQYQQTRQINQYDLNGNLIHVWDYIGQAATELNINRSNISACCSNKYERQTAGGFKWSYSDSSDLIDKFDITTQQNDYNKGCSNE